MSHSHDLKFEEAFFDYPQDPIDLSDLIPGMREIIETYTFNMQRAHGLVEFNIMMIAAAMRSQEAALRARHELTGGRLDFTEEEQQDSKLKSTHDQLALAMVHYYEGITGEDDFKELQRISAEKFVALFKKYEGEVGAESILGTVLIMGCMALEVMWKDLHTFCLEKHPALFKAVTPPSKGWSFITRWSARLAYKQIFLTDRTEIEQAILDESIDALGIMRNVLVHAGGNADDGFLNGPPRHPEAAAGKNSFLPFAINMKTGTKVPIDGVLVRKILEQSIKSGYDLMLAVNKWIKDKTP